jgi:hypothetical protein
MEPVAASEVEKDRFTMKPKSTELARGSQKIFALRHIETGEYICLRQQIHEYVACFSEGDTAFQFRNELGLLEHVDVVGMRLKEMPFDYFWLDGEMISRSLLADEAAHRA